MRRTGADATVELIGWCYADEQLADLHTQRRRVFSVCTVDVDDVDTLQARIQRLEQYKRLTEQLNVAVGEERQACRPLDAAERSDLVELPEADQAQALERRREQAEAGAANARELRERVDAIQAAIDQAKA